MSNLRGAISQCLSWRPTRRRGILEGFSIADSAALRRSGFRPLCCGIDDMCWALWRVDRGRGGFGKRAGSPKGRVTPQIWPGSASQGSDRLGAAGAFCCAGAGCRGLGRGRIRLPQRQGTRQCGRRSGGHLSMQWLASWRGRRSMGKGIGDREGRFCPGYDSRSNSEPSEADSGHTPPLRLRARCSAYSTSPRRPHQGPPQSWPAALG